MCSLKGSRLCRSGLVPQPCRKYVDPTLPKKRGRPKAVCVACKSGAMGCTGRNVVYQLECSCGQKYVRETHRSLATRIQGT